MECRKPAAIDRATALRYMGASGWTPDAATAALLDKAEQIVLTAAAPRAVYRRLPRTALPLENCGSDLTRHLQGCDRSFCWQRPSGPRWTSFCAAWN